jgi:cathepsin A (carboxypeptidase C)
LQGNERWLEELETVFHKEFASAKTEPWITIESATKAGTVRSAGGSGKTAGNVTFVTVYEAGSVVLCIYHTPLPLLTLASSFIRHMVPYDQPDVALVSPSFSIIFANLI